MELTDLSPTAPGLLSRGEGQLRRRRSSAIPPGQRTGLPTFERDCFLIAPIGEERGEVRPRIPQLVPYDDQQSASDFLETIRPERRHKQHP